MTVGTEAHLESHADERLIAEMLRGSPAAFGVIFERHGASVHSLAHRIVGDHALADDVTQDVFLWFLASAHRFDAARGGLPAYLLVRCRSRSLDLLRSEGSRRQRERTQRNLTRRPPSDSSDVERVAIQADGEQEALRLLSLLPVAERDALHLAFFGELSYRDVATELRIPEGTAKSRIRSGLRRLRLEMEDPAGPALIPHGHFRAVGDVEHANLVVGARRLLNAG